VAVGGRNQYEVSHAVQVLNGSEAPSSSRWQVSWLAEVFVRQVVQGQAVVLQVVPPPRQVAGSRQAERGSVLGWCRWQQAGGPR